VTGRLAEASLRTVVSELSTRLGFAFEVTVPGVQVAALLHTGMLLKRLEVSEEIDRVVLPGWCQGDLSDLEQHFGRPFERGPKNLYDLPEYFGLNQRKPVVLDDYNIEIVAEINHATRLSTDDLVREALTMAGDGADVIDVGCIPGESSMRVAEIVAALRAENLRVSIDSFDRAEVEQAVGAGAELILSCNQTNLDWVSGLGAEVVAIPDVPDDLASLDRTIQQLDRVGARFRVDPIIEPIGMGFTRSLQRYMDVRSRYPDVAMMMGTGNITEMTEVDSAGVNMILAAICEELKIHSILTTQVINWCRTSVAELDSARRVLSHAVKAGVVPKHLDASLVMLRDGRLRPSSAENLQRLAEALTDSNFRIFAEQDGLHLMNRRGHWAGEDAFSVFASAMADSTSSVDHGHAFYLGYEMARAELARHLGKQYSQDEEMNWGLLGNWNASSAVHDHRPDDVNEDN